jgi:5-aminolevulinate synthase
VAHLKTDQSLRERHQTQAQILKLRLKGMGLPIIDHGSHIVPVIVGDPVHTKKLSDMLLEDFGIYVQPINFPTVPRGTERLRFTPSPVHGPREMDALVSAMDSLWSHCALNRAEMAG